MNSDGSKEKASARGRILKVGPIVVGALADVGILWVNFWAEAPITNKAVVNFGGLALLGACAAFEYVGSDNFDAVTTTEQSLFDQGVVVDLLFARSPSSLSIVEDDLSAWGPPPDRDPAAEISANTTTLVPIDQSVVTQKPSVQ